MSNSHDQLERLRRRDGQAWSEECVKHTLDIFGFIFRLVARDRSVADDVQQDVWLEAIRRIDHFDPERGTLRGWLFEIARRRVAGFWRQRTKHPPTTDLEFAEKADHSLLPHEVMEQLDRAALVRAALLAMPPDRSMVLTVKYMNDLSVADIAAREGKSVKAIESLLTRARDELRRMLGPCFEEPKSDHYPKSDAVRPASDFTTSIPQPVPEKRQ